MTSRESSIPSNGSSSSTTRILRAVGWHPTRGLIHATALLRRGDHAKERASELRQTLFAQGCTSASDVISTRVDEHQSADDLLRHARSRLRERRRHY